MVCDSKFWIEKKNRPAIKKLNSEMSKKYMQRVGKVMVR